MATGERERLTIAETLRLTIGERDIDYGREKEKLPIGERETDDRRDREIDYRRERERSAVGEREIDTRESEIHDQRERRFTTERRLGPELKRERTAKFEEGRITAKREGGGENRREARERGRRTKQALRKETP